MTERSDFNGVMSDWLDEQAGHGMPSYLDETLARTTRTRQRPWWSSHVETVRSKPSFSVMRVGPPRAQPEVGHRRRAPHAWSGALD